MHFLDRKGVTHRGVADLIAGCPQLNELNLTGTDMAGTIHGEGMWRANLSVDGAVFLAPQVCEAVIALPDVLRDAFCGKQDHVNMQFRTQFSDNANKAPGTCTALSLQKADLHGCEPSEAQWAVFGATLKAVNFRDAKGVTIDGIAGLCRACPNIEKIDLRSCGLEEPPVVLARLQHLRELELKFNPFLEAPQWKDFNRMNFVMFIREREKNDPALALAARTPGPNPFTHEAFHKAWGNDPTPLLDALLTMVTEWGFKPPIDDAKWGYLAEYVFPLKRVWGDARRFAQLQDAAREHKGELDRACRAIVADVANDAAGGGAWICTQLDDIAGDIARGARKSKAESSCCWIPPSFFAGANEFPTSCQNKFDREVLPTAVRCLADASFDAFRTAVLAALPAGTWLEPDPLDTPGTATATATAPGPPAPGALQVRCIRSKCVKGVPRMSTKVLAAQDRAAKSEGGAVWPFTATIGDALRASVKAPDAAGIRRAWEAIRDNDAWTVIRLKNKFRVSASRLKRTGSDNVFSSELQEMFVKTARRMNRPGIRSVISDFKDQHTDHYTNELQEGEKQEYPNLHVNVLFQAEGCAPIVAEIQVHHAGVLTVSKQDHKLYEVTRAKSIAALATNKRSGGGARRGSFSHHRQEQRRGGEGVVGGAGMNAARRLR